MNHIFNKDYVDFFKDIKNEVVDLVLTDPPFGIGYQNNYTHNKLKVLKNDEEEFSYKTLAKESMRVLKNNSAFFAFSCWSEYGHHTEEIKEENFQLKEPLIVQKRPSGTTDLRGTFQTNSDWIIFATKGRFEFKETMLMKNKKAGIVPNKGRKPVPVWKKRLPSCWFGEEFPFSTENPMTLKKENINHPTVKSVEFFKWIISLTTNIGDLVVDPFVGSGTCAIACKELNRNFLGCEIDKEYYIIANKSVELHERM